ncbi:MAG: Pr6Pr family membrane protein [Gemmatimonadaceae bacterium]
MARSRWVTRFAAVAAALGWTALVLQFYLSMRLSMAGDVGFVGGLITYFSFFTILTNILVAMALTASLLRVRSSVAEFFTRPAVNTGIAASIAVVGIGYSVLLRNLWDPEGLQLVADMLLHDLMPVLFVIYWWVAVPEDGVRWGHIWRWMLYPVAYFVYVMVRGAMSGVYPYPFIDAGELGYARAFGNAVGVLLGFIAVALLLVALGRLKGTRNHRVRSA